MAYVSTYVFLCSTKNKPRRDMTEILILGVHHPLKKGDRTFHHLGNNLYFEEPHL